MQLMIGIVITLAIILFTVMGSIEMFHLIVLGREFHPENADEPVTPLRRAILIVWVIISAVVAFATSLSNTVIQENPLALYCFAFHVTFVFIAALPYSFANFSRVLSGSRS